MPAQQERAGEVKYVKAIDPMYVSYSVNIASHQSTISGLTALLRLAFP